jgi:hypothetical protein
VIRGDKLRAFHADFIEDLDTVTSDSLVFVREVVDEFLYLLLVLRFHDLNRKLLIGDLVTSTEARGKLVEDRQRACVLL